MILFNNAGVSSSSGEVPTTFERSTSSWWIKPLTATPSSRCACRIALRGLRPKGDALEV